MLDGEKLSEMARDPRLIPGIYNYCDRWCERCFFTARCLNYAMGREMGEEDGDEELHDLENKKFWEHLHSVFELTKEMVEDMMEKEGIELDAEEMEEFAEEERQREEEAHSHEIAQAAMQYGEMVDRWFETEGEVFKDKGEDLQSRAQMELEGDDPEAEALAIADAVEVIRWYQYQLYVKLMRALEQDDWEDEETDGDPMQTDSNGSAKVALLAMDRSIGAWGELREYLPEQEESILETLVHLDRLRRKTEKTFPDARKFKRPGFDDESPKFEVEESP